MANPKNIYHDRTALLLISLLSFLTLASVVLTLLKLNATKGTINYIISYRESLGIDRYATGTAYDMLSFVVAAIVLFIFGIILATRAYKIKRELALVVLLLNIPLVVLVARVSNSLLSLR